MNKNLDYNERVYLKPEYGECDQVKVDIIQNARGAQTHKQYKQLKSHEYQ